MFYVSPTLGRIDEEALKSRVSEFMAEMKMMPYRIIVGTDSNKMEAPGYDFVSALVVHRVGEGGIYFYTREIVKRKYSLKERMYEEAIRSLQMAAQIADLFKENGISKYNVEIHVDIGQKGETREVINEIVGMVRGSGYDCKIKPDSFAASKVADRHT